jgi:hypothetical protein
VNDSQPEIAELLRLYARELADTEPSPDLDARIDELVAGSGITATAGAVTRPGAARPKSARARRRRTWRVPRWAAIAGCAALAILIGIVIGMRLEHRAARPLPVADTSRDPSWPPAELSMWPTDSVAFKVPAEYSPDGRLVVVDPHSRRGGKRFWVDIVVSNDGTVRIEKVVPAGKADGITLQSP